MRGIVICDKGSKGTRHLEMENHTHAANCYAFPVVFVFFHSIVRLQWKLIITYNPKYNQASLRHLFFQ
jgi:hypothetical protein